jgi:NADPH:quinone reductase-like Zn-dependent oxidoreductase
VRAVVCERFRPPDVLRVEKVPVQSPGVNQVLVQVVATSVNISDWEWTVVLPRTAHRPVQT